MAMDWIVTYQVCYYPKNRLGFVKWEVNKIRRYGSADANPYSGVVRTGYVRSVRVARARGHKYVDGINALDARRAAKQAKKVCEPA